jgi:hypothetical protein
MTIAQKIKSRVDSLPPSQQNALLKIIESFESRCDRAPVKRRPAASDVDAAIAEAAGIWKARKDLPKSSAAASRMLRRRLMRRGGNV